MTAQKPSRKMTSRSRTGLPPALPSQKLLLTLSDVGWLLGVGQTRMRQLASSEGFPKPVMLSCMAPFNRLRSMKFYKASEIRSWIERL